MFQNIFVFQTFCSLDASLSTCRRWAPARRPHRPPDRLPHRLAPPDRPIAGIPRHAQGPAIYTKLPIHRHRAALLVFLAECNHIAPSLAFVSGAWKTKTDYFRGMGGESPLKDIARGLGVGSPTEHQTSNGPIRYTVMDINYRRSLMPG